MMGLDFHRVRGITLTDQRENEGSHGEKWYSGNLLVEYANGDVDTMNVYTDHSMNPTPIALNGVDVDLNETIIGENVRLKKELKKLKNQISEVISQNC